jgi:hypothetical protein
MSLFSWLSTRSARLVQTDALIARLGDAAYSAASERARRSAAINNTWYRRHGRASKSRSQGARELKFSEAG